MSRKVSYRKLTALCAVLAMVLIQSVIASKAIISPSTASADVDLNSESRTLDSFVDDLQALDKKCAALNKKSSLTSAEVDPLQRAGNDLRNRLSGVQNSLREIIRKLKAAGQWDNFDARVLATIKDAQDQASFRQTSFKRELEDLASQLSSGANEITSPLENLRRKVARTRDSAIEPEFRAVRVAYDPAMFWTSIKCRLASVRFGISGFVHGEPTPGARKARRCECFPDQYPDCAPTT